MVFMLNDELVFPDPHLAEDDGLLAVGGDLRTERLILAYDHGIFPWFSFKREVPMWFCPMSRFVIFPNEVHVSHSMRSLINKERYRVSVNMAFERVIENCSHINDRDNQEGAWLGPDMVEAYTRLHRLDRAASVEVWDGDDLVGGLYGVTAKRCFMGESMFSLAPGASKLALIGLCRHMELLGWKLIDCQFETPHLKTMGGRHIPYDDYMDILNA